jgi:hypothetical protein
MLKAEMECLKAVTEQWLGERDKLLHRIMDLESKLQEMKSDSTNRASFLESEIDRMEKEYNDTLQKLVLDREDYQKETLREIALNEKIRERQ